MKITDNEHFRGTNDLTTREAYYYRLLYSVVHEPGNAYKKVKKNVTSFEYGESRLYGRVLPFTHIPVLVKESLLKNPKTQDPEKSTRVLNFVADAFDDFSKAFEDAQFKNTISMDAGFLTSPVPKVAYISPTAHYQAYRTACYEVFIEYLTKMDIHRKIRDFESFYTQFHNYFKLHCRALPFTIEAFQRSMYGNLNMTGLAIDLAEFDASKDKLKVERVFSNKNYGFYENAAMQFGFKIDKNCPWRIVADLGSPAMKRYMENRNFKGASSVMSRAYEPAYLVGYNSFKTMLISYYNAYVRDNPNTIGPRRNGLGDYVSHVQERTTVDIFDFVKEFGEKYFLEKYVTFRSMEEHEAFTSQKIKNISDRAIELAKIKGMEAALKYINEDVCDTKTHSGSVTDLLTKRRRREEEEQRIANMPAPGTKRY